MSTDLRQYHRDRRAAAKRAGVCIQCHDDQTQPGRSKCAGCMQANAAARPRSDRPRTWLFTPRYTPAQVAQMHHHASQGETEIEIAARFGCHQSTVHRNLTKPQTIAA